jgi:hypothetical protein
MSRKTTRVVTGNKGKITLVTNAQPSSAPVLIEDGVQLSGYNPAPVRWLLKIKASSAEAPATVEGAYIYIWDDGVWLKFIKLNDGNDIVVGAQGYAEIIEYPGVVNAASFACDNVDNNIDVIMCPLLEIDI